jgi:hypothetical protein
VLRLTSLALALLALLEAAPARADGMDLALGRLRIVGGREGCLPPRTDVQFCPNNELFERLVSEMAVGMAPPITSPAHSIGARGMRIGLTSTVTTIEADKSYWILGTEGDDASAAEPLNAAPDQALVFNRLELRKGMPLGFEVVGFLGQGMRTSLWVLGAGLKWALVEGFRSELGQLPDVALSGSLSRSVGGGQANFHIGSVELTLSKPFVANRSWVLSPLVGVQALIVDVESGVIDLTPGGVLGDGDSALLEDAFESCRPQPGHAPGGDKPTNIDCTGDGRDFDNDVVFDPVMQSRMRIFLGAQARYDLFTIALTVHIDPSAPSVDAADLNTPSSSSGRVARQVAFNLALAATL